MSVRAVARSITGDPPISSRPPRGPVVAGHRMWFVCVLLIIGTIVAGATVIWRLRDSALTHAGREMTNLGIVLAEQTSRTIQSVDMVLKEVQSKAGALGLRSPEELRAHFGTEDARQFLVNHLHNLPQATSITLIDAKGALLNWSDQGPVPDVDLTDRDYFRHLSEVNEPDAFVAGPTKGKISGKWLIFVVRRINDRDGAFLGLVAGLIDTQYLEDFYRTISMVPGESVTLLHRDGVVIAGYPDIEERRERQMPRQSPWFARVANGGGDYESPGFLGSRPSIITVHPLRDYPLVVDANVSKQAALKNWNEEAAAILATMLGVAAGLPIIFAVLIRQFGRERAQNEKLHQSETALRASERRLKAYAGMSADWFWEQDADLCFVYDSKIPLTSQPTDVGKKRWELADPAMDPRRWDTHKAVLEARGSFRDFRFERIRTDGKRRYMSISGDPVFDDAGQFRGYHGTGRDITADVEAAEQLRFAKERAEAGDRAKSKFLTGMIDELRSPLHAVVGIAQVMHDRGESGSGGGEKHWAGDILASGRHLLDVVNSVLALSRIDSDRHEPADDRVDLAVMARACCGMIRLQAATSRVEIDCAVSDSVILADRRAIRSIILNLLINTVRSTSPDGRVAIRTEDAPNAGIAIVVTSNAIASASAGPLPRQSNKHALKARKYACFDLDATHKLAALHGGALTIEDDQDHGTVIRVTLPSTRVIVEARRSASAGKAAARSTEEMTGRVAADSVGQ